MGKAPPLGLEHPDSLVVQTADVKVSEPWFLWILPSVTICPFPEPLLGGPEGAGGGGSCWAHLPSRGSSGELWGAGDTAFLLIRVINASPQLSEHPAAAFCHWIWYPVAVV